MINNCNSVIDDSLPTKNLFPGKYYMIGAINYPISKHNVRHFKVYGISKLLQAKRSNAGMHKHKCTYTCLSTRGHMICAVEIFTRSTKHFAKLD